MSKPLKMAIQSGMHDVVAASPVDIRPDKRGRLPRVMKEISYKEPPTVEDQLVTITNEGDPLTFLIDVMHGKGVPVYFIEPDPDDEEGKKLVVSVEYHNADMDDRIDIARYLLDKSLPKATRPPANPKPKLTTIDAGEDQSRMDQMVDNAVKNDDGS